MCIIIDTNTLATVFDNTSNNHSEFKPVFDWIYSGNGKVVYGGTKYTDEIKKKYLSLFVELGRKRKAVYIDNETVDDKENEVSTQLISPDFDDQHLVGLLIVSGTKLICSLDSRAYPFFKHPTFFRPARNRPKIYNQLRNKDLLIDRNIASICKPCNQS